MEVVHTEVEEVEEEVIGVEDLPEEICQIEEVIPLREEADLNILLPVMIHVLNTIQVDLKDIQAEVVEVNIQIVINAHVNLILVEMTIVLPEIPPAKGLEAILIRVEVVAVAVRRGTPRRTVVHRHRLHTMTIRARHRRRFMRTRDRANEPRHITVRRTVIRLHGAMHLRHPLALARWRPRLRDTTLVEEEYRIKALTTEVAFPLAAAVEGVDFIG